MCRQAHWTVFAPRDASAGHVLFKSGLSFPAAVYHNKKDATPYKVASLVGPAGFEPTDGGVKVLCLTAWRRPIMKKDRAACITVRSLVGCLERFELSASRATIWRANQLRHRHHIMRPKGLEPPAHCLEGSCSIQLSYGRIVVLPIHGARCV